MGPIKKPRWISWPFIILMAIVLFVMLTSKENYFLTLSSNKTEILRLETEIAQVNDSTEQLLKKYDEIHSQNQTVEKIAREQYHMKRENEDVYITDIK